MISIVITLIVIGVLLWLVTAYIPMDATIKRIIQIVVLICVVLWFLNVFGLLPLHDSPPVPNLGRN